MTTNEIQNDILKERMERRRAELIRKNNEAIERKIKRLSALYEKSQDKRYLTQLSKYIDVDLTPNDYGVPEKN